MASMVTYLTLIYLFLSYTASAFSGNFELTNLFVSSAFQADPTATEDTYLDFDFRDEDTPEIDFTHCVVGWAVGLSPPTSGVNTCDNASFTVKITSWHGVGNLTMELGHQYIDNSVGDAPYNVLAKYAQLNLTYPATEFYECDFDNAECQSYEGETIVANITTAVA